MKILLTTSTLVLALAVLPLTVAAEDRQKPLGNESKAWIDLQKSGSQASGAPRPMPADIADKVYQRYADSFKQPIPAEFKRQSTGDSGNASGQ
ncbi:MAG: DUF3613 domain-containing protein [Pseudomonadota bacterium]